MNWIGLAPDRDMRSAVVSTVMNFQVPQISGNFLTSLGTIRSSKTTPFDGVSSLVCFFFVG